MFIFKKERKNFDVFRKIITFAPNYKTKDKSIAILL